MGHRNFPTMRKSPLDDLHSRLVAQAIDTPQLLYHVQIFFPPYFDPDMLLEDTVALTSLWLDQLNDTRSTNLYEEDAPMLVAFAIALVSVERMHDAGEVQCNFLPPISSILHRLQNVQRSVASLAWNRHFPTQARLGDLLLSTSHPFVLAHVRIPALCLETQSLYNRLCQGLYHDPLRNKNTPPDVDVDALPLDRLVLGLTPADAPCFVVQLHEIVYRSIESMYNQYPLVLATVSHFPRSLAIHHDRTTSSPQLPPSPTNTVIVPHSSFLAHLHLLDRVTSFLAAACVDLHPPSLAPAVDLVAHFGFLMQPLSTTVRLRQRHPVPVRYHVCSRDF
jgi:hypothetical protein